MSRVLPILFNTDMVRAILDGRKMVTRRVIKPRQLIGILPDKCKNGTPEEFLKEKKHMFKPYCDMADAELIKTAYNPPYQSEDILYVRETWRVGARDIRNQMIAFDYKDGTCGELTYIHDRELFERLVNQSREDARKAKCEYNGMDFIWEKGKSPCRWHPSIHMPKEAARIWLKVKDVRVEWLQAITKEQARAEGCDGRCECPSSGAEGSLSCVTRDFSIEKFETVWDSTIKKSDLDRYGWYANPWVWVIEFERCEKQLLEIEETLKGGE
ncbi:MAG: hypothetical protein MR945_09250 [Agathobacter sp.]|nr:hypothetical protein [Agathobacter sp.]